MSETVRDHWVEVYRRYPWTPVLTAVLTFWYRIPLIPAALFGGLGLFFALLVLILHGRGASLEIGGPVIYLGIGLSLSWRALTALWPGLAPMVMINGPIESLGPDGRGGLAVTVAGRQWAVPATVGQGIGLRQYVRLWVGMSGQVHALVRRELHSLGETLPTEPLAGGGDGRHPELWRRIYARSVWEGVRAFPMQVFNTVLWLLLARGCVLSVILTIRGEGIEDWRLLAVVVVATPFAIWWTVVDLWCWGERIYGWVVPRQVVVAGIEHVGGNAGQIIAAGQLWELPVEVCRGLSIGEAVRITYRAASRTVLLVDVGLLDGDRQRGGTGSPSEARP